MHLPLLVLFVSAEIVANYKFWKNIGQLFYDYTENFQHAVNGGSIYSLKNDTVCSDRGVYFDLNSYISLPSNEISPTKFHFPTGSRLILYIYPLNYGKLLSRYSNSQHISISFSNLENPFNVGPIIYVPITPLKKWQLLTLENLADSLNIYFQTSLKYSIAMNEDPLNMWQSADFLKLGDTFEGFIYEMWVSNTFSSFSNFITKSGTNGCTSKVCSFGNSTLCDCDYCITSPGTFCVAAVNSPYLSSNQLTCNQVLEPADVFGNCRICPAACGDFCLSNFECLDFCFAPCANCSTENYCFKCADSTALLNNGKCECPFGYYLNGFKCVKCPPFCAKCTSELNCVVCADPNAVIVTYEFGYKCQCKFGTFYEYDQCVNCSQICIGCKKNAYDCIMCADLNSEKKDNQCVCKSGFYLAEKCLQCKKHCEECRSLEVCVKCINGYTLVDNKCVENRQVEEPEKVCGFGSFIKGTECKPCSAPCNWCIESADNCVNCIQNAFINSTFGCECQKDFLFVNNSCAAVLVLNFSAVENQVFFEFSSNLTHELQSPEVFSNNSELTFWVFNNSNLVLTVYCYDTTQNLTIFINFTEKVQGINNATLFNTYYETVVPVCLSNTTFFSNTAAKTIGYIVTMFTVMSSLLGINGTGPSLLWTLIGSMQLLSYLSMQNINYPSLLQQYFQALNYLLIPNFFTYIISDLGPNDFLFTSGRDLSIMIFSVILYFLFVNLKKVVKGKSLTLVNKILRNYKWNVFIRIWIMCYVEIVNGVISQIMVMDFSIVRNSVNSVFGLVFGFICLLTPAWAYIFVISNFYKINQSIFLDKYSSLVYEFKMDSIDTVVYYYYYLIRRLVYMLNLNFLQYFPMIQSLINILISVISLVSLFKYKFFKGPREVLFNIVCETAILLSTLISSAFMFEIQEPISSILTYICLSLGGTITLLNLGLTSYGLIEKMKKYKEDKLQHGVTFAAHKNLHSFAGLHISSASVREENEIL